MDNPSDLIAVDDLSDAELDLLSPVPLANVLASHSARKPSPKPKKTLLNAFDDADGADEDFLLN